MNSIEVASTAIRLLRECSSITLGSYTAGGIPILRYSGDTAGATAAHEKQHENLSVSSTYGQFTILLAALDSFLQREGNRPEEETLDIRQFLGELVSSSVLVQEATATFCELQTVLLTRGHARFKRQFESLWGPYRLAFGTMWSLLATGPKLLDLDPLSVIAHGIGCAVMDVRLPDEWNNFRTIRDGTAFRILKEQCVNPDLRLVALLREAENQPKFLHGLIEAIQPDIVEWRRAMEVRSSLAYSQWHSIIFPLTTSIRNRIIGWVADLKLFPVDLERIDSPGLWPGRQHLVAGVAEAFGVPIDKLKSLAAPRFHQIELDEENYAVEISDRAFGRVEVLGPKQVNEYITRTTSKLPPHEVVFSGFVFRAQEDPGRLRQGLLVAKPGMYVCEVVPLRVGLGDNSELTLMYLKESATIQDLTKMELSQVVLAFRQTLAVFVAVEDRSVNCAPGEWSRWAHEMPMPVYLYNPRSSIASLKTVLGWYPQSPEALFSTGLRVEGMFAVTDQSNPFVRHLFFGSEMFCEVSQRNLDEWGVPWRDVESLEDALPMAMAAWQCTLGSLGSYLEQASVEW